MKALPVINCTDKPCGVCCLGMGNLPAEWYMDGDDKSGKPFGVGMIDSLPPELQAELRTATVYNGDLRSAPIEFLRAFASRQQEPCMWLDLETKRCKHYEHRPEVCRNAVKPGDSSCRADRKHYGIDPNPRYRFKGGRVVRDA